MNETERDFEMRSETQSVLNSIGLDVADVISSKFVEEYMEMLDGEVEEYVREVWNRYTKKEKKEMAEYDMDIDTREEGWEEGADENEINDILNLMKRIRYVLRDRLKTTQMYFDLVDERINETER